MQFAPTIILLRPYHWRTVVSEFIELRAPKSNIDISTKASFIVYFLTL